MIMFDVSATGKQFLSPLYDIFVCSIPTGTQFLVFEDSKELRIGEDYMLVIFALCLYSMLVPLAVNFCHYYLIFSYVQSLPIPNSSSLWIPMNCVSVKTTC